MTTAAALVIVESYFGATRTVAEAVAAGLTDAGVRARVLDVDQAPDAPPADLDLLILGAPTHNRGLPTTSTRATARKRGAATPARGVREWLATASIPASPRVAAFDTVTAKNWLAGSAAKAIAKTLRRAGWNESAVTSSIAARGGVRGGAGGGPPARAWGCELAGEGAVRR